MRGHGTKFHHVYVTQPKLYDIFSAAESFDINLTKAMNHLLVGHRLLDVAAGTGEKTSRYASRFDTVIALDKSRILVSYGLVHNRRDNMSFIIGTASSMPFPDESFDCILTTWGSFQMNKAIPEMKRVLSSGGKIVRIGTCERDDLTSLFPNYSLRRARAINRSYRNRGFSEERHRVIVEFSSLKKAKNILCKICGCDSKQIRSKRLMHDVVLHVYYKR